MLHSGRNNSAQHLEVNEHFTEARCTRYTPMRLTTSTYFFLSNQGDITVTRERVRPLLVNSRTTYKTCIITSTLTLVFKPNY